MVEKSKIREESGEEKSKRKDAQNNLIHSKPNNDYNKRSKD
jgi:hypothetical protein